LFRRRGGHAPVGPPQRVMRLPQRRCPPTAPVQPLGTQPYESVGSIHNESGLCQYILTPNQRGVPRILAAPKGAPDNSPRRKPWVGKWPTELFFCSCWSPGKGDRRVFSPAANVGRDEIPAFCRPSRGLYRQGKKDSGPLVYPRLTPWAIVCRAFGTQVQALPSVAPATKNGHSAPCSALVHSGDKRLDFRRILG
jgi:hypothetical protein